MIKEQTIKIQAVNTAKVNYTAEDLKNIILYAVYNKEFKTAEDFKQFLKLTNCFIKNNNEGLKE
jgi:hypothetical protein